MNPGDGAKELLSLQRFSNLKDECETIDHQEHGIAAALGDLWNCHGIHPAKVAGLALEDSNCHKDAANCFVMSGDVKILESPMSLNEIQEATNDGQNKLSVYVAISFEFLLTMKREDFDSYVRQTLVCGGGSYLSEIRATPIGVHEGKIVLEVFAKWN